MNAPSVFHRLRTASVAALLVTVSSATAFSAEEQFPKFSVFEVELKAYFEGLPKHQPGDIISKREVSRAFKILKKMGWEVDDRKKILALILDDSSYMVKQLRSKKGRVLMRDFSKYPHAYDRLDRFLRLPRSKRFLQGLLNGPDAYKMFEYMTTSKGGENLGKQLSNAKKGHNFNKPTGRIYTAKDLLNRLKESHALHLRLLKEQAEKEAEQVQEEK